MPSTPFQAQLLTGRMLANLARISDGLEAPQRSSQYREGYVLSLIPTKHLLADEGSYFTANNGSGGTPTAAAPTVFSATNPFWLIYNQDAVGGRNIYLDFATLVNTAIGTAGTNVQCAVATDVGNRYSNGGIALTPTNPNTSIAQGSVAKVYAGNITASAASVQARTPVGLRTLKGTAPVLGDNLTMRFGSADAPDIVSVSTVTFSNVNLPPIVVPPGSSALIYIWLAAQSAASSWGPEIGWWER